MNVQGTVTETDSGAWTLTNEAVPMVTFAIDPYSLPIPLISFWDPGLDQLIAAGGSYTSVSVDPSLRVITSITIPQSLLDQQIAGIPGLTWQQYLTSIASPIGINNGGIHSGMLDPGQVQYTTGYNARYSGISGQQTFSKSVGITTTNTIADQSNLNARTSIQFVAVNAGRATNSEDLIIDGAGNSTDTASAILCPFAQQVSAVVPPYCNIVQAGSSFDSTLTSTVTSANDRFAGTDSTFPVVLNYDVASKGITLPDGTLSPMIGSASAYMKAHIQESRNVHNGTMSNIITGPFIVPGTPSKSEDLTYSETSTASGLINNFEKSMSYQSGFNLV